LAFIAEILTKNH